MVDPPENNENWRNPHHHVKVGNNEHRGGKRNIYDHISEEQAGDPPIHKGDDEAEGEQLRDREDNVDTTQGQNPVLDLDGGWDGDRHR